MGQSAFVEASGAYVHWLIARAGISLLLSDHQESEVLLSVGLEADQIVMP